MKDRIVQLIENMKISPAEFADQIGIQRSSLSHVMNGRNNPGYSFIQKILEAYPKLNSRWLITGIGAMFDSGLPEQEKVTIKQVEPVQQANLFSTISEPEKPGPEKRKEEPSSNQTQHIPHKESDKIVSSLQNSTTVLNKTPEKEVTRVLVFYNDRTFEEYKPA